MQILVENGMIKLDQKYKLHGSLMPSLHKLFICYYYHY
jgi:hypothetical protein